MLVADISSEERKTISSADHHDERSCTKTLRTQDGWGKGARYRAKTYAC